MNTICMIGYMIFVSSNSFSCNWKQSELRTLAQKARMFCSGSGLISQGYWKKIPLLKLAADKKLYSKRDHKLEGIGSKKWFSAS